ncbi:DUF4179 domain-containing protein [Paenibacillus sp. 481]|uniref:DUF4179 domain-containing protein n=1 Tax=Paenibacillus sp. 481 TaxID=2835869 RepID=UPI001E520B03|nr:DUF4179 domain-containing protein [Paenibacillus sp. 481]UHA74969.1 DUF4179 domain-containing protein [Paenibacillus sp. 481]
MSMKCLTYERMDELLANGQLETMMPHMDGCSSCRKLLDACMEEQNMMHRMLYADKLDDSFTANVMGVIVAEGPIVKADYDLSKQVASPLFDEVFGSGTSQASHNQVGQNQALQNSVDQKQATEGLHSLLKDKQDKRVKRQWMRLSRKRLAAAILLFIIASFIFTQPTIANWVHSLFGAGETSDVGLLQSENRGIHHFTNIKVEDQGYTLEIKEIVVDTTRLVMAYRVRKPDGEFNSNLLSTDSIDVVDANGKSILAQGGRTQNAEDGYYITDLALYGPLETDRVTIKGNVDHLGYERYPQSDIESTIVKGDWRFSLDVDMTAARKQMKIVPLNGEYVAPDGTRIKPTRMIYHASAFQIEVQTKLPVNVAPPNEDLILEVYHQVGFYLKDNKGSYIARSPRNDKNYMFNFDNKVAFPLYTTCTREGKGDSAWVTCMYTFSTYKTLPTPAVLGIDNYNLPITTNDSISFKVSELPSQPALFKARGDEIHILKSDGFYISGLDGEKPSLQLKVKGILNNNEGGDNWIAHDEHGNEYRVYLEGGYTSYPDKNYVELVDDANFLIKGLGHIPDKLTLTRTATDINFRNINWTMKLPEIKLK